MKIAYTRPDMGVPANDPSLIREVDRVGTVRYRNSDDQLHREDGPAVELPEGTRFWFLNGKLHREDGPAVERPKPLRVRTWTCGCGARLDRDYNAAVNIMVAAGLAETQNACGADIRLALARAVSVEAGTRWSDKGMAA